MGLRVLASHVVPHDRPGLMAEAKTLAKDRKILRLLDATTHAPFVCVLEAHAAAGGGDPEQVALFSVSEVDYAPPPCPLDVLGADAATQDATRHLSKHAEPTGWIRSMPNSGLCMTSIVGEFRGPNLRLVGHGPSVVSALALAHAALLDGQATTAIVVAYSDGSEGSPATDAAAVVLAEGGDGELAIPDHEGVASQSAFAALGGIIDDVFARRDLPAEADAAAQ